MTMVTYTRTTATVIVETVNIAAPHHLITLHRHKRSDYYFKQHTTTEHRHRAAIQTETGHDYYFDINMVIVSPARRM